MSLHYCVSYYIVHIYTCEIIFFNLIIIITARPHGEMVFKGTGNKYIISRGLSENEVLTGTKSNVTLLLLQQRKLLLLPLISSHDNKPGEIDRIHQPFLCLLNKCSLVPSPTPSFSSLLSTLYCTKQRRKAGRGTGYEARINGYTVVPVHVY